MLDYLIGEDHGVLLAIGPEEVAAHRIPGSRDLKAALKRYRSALRRPLFNADARNDPRADLERSLDHGVEIRKALLDPVRDVLDDVERIYIVPDTEIALLPFVALPWNDDKDADDWVFLGDRFEVAVLPMAGGAPTWDRSRTPILLAGDPLPDAAGEYPALPTSGMELDLVSRSWKNGEQSRLDRSDLTSANMLEQPLGSFRTLHFATHAVASTADPNGCAVYLSGGDRIGLKQILDLDLQASPLVVLSACQTGEGELIPGEGVVGLGWAFLRAGAKGVVASLWSVEDTASTELMALFHRSMSQGNDPVTALSVAQRSMAAQRFHPAYWAPFIIVLRPDTGS
ncbi:MAG: CHAT domain-containing protein [Acidobacteria bacterium]|uniref:CHAT domain-containing protein n=1 Tax=Candidatus Polarisedimenticola svalbardensis TaxID=2886004 RepID=A0A8J6XXP0_9BACT|nr:CHAT domain-containing protein [Candidatus Polarisedimenticola svalbardensis]